MQRTSSAHLRMDRLSGIDEGDLAEVDSAASSPRSGDGHDSPFTSSSTLSSPGGSMRLLGSSSDARNRWRRLRHTVQFAAHMTQMRYRVVTCLMGDTDVTDFTTRLMVRVCVYLMGIVVDEH